MACQETERNIPDEAHLLSRDSRVRDLSELIKKSIEQGALTSWKRRREGAVRTRKETARARRTHFLETAEGGTYQDTERNRPSEAHSLSGDSRGKDLSGHGKNRAREAHSLSGDSRGWELSGHRKKVSE